MTTPDNKSESQVSRDNYDSHWLAANDAVNRRSRKFKHHAFTEAPSSRDQVRDSLSEAIVDHHFHHRRVQDQLRSLGHKHAAEFFADELPTNNETRKGNFGEVVASEHLIQRHGFKMPVFKIRFRDSHQLPMRGEDIVAFELDDAARIVRVVIGEAKAVVKFRNSTVRDAHARLETAFRPRPMTLSMIAEILYEADRNDLAKEIDDVSIALTRKRRFPRENWIVLINEDQPDDPFAVLEDEDSLVPHLHCVSIKLPRLTELVNDLFDNPYLASGDSDGA